jgi:hypothetical protein
MWRGKTAVAQKNFLSVAKLERCENPVLPERIRKIASLGLQRRGN